MHQREQQHASTAAELHVLVHSGLKPYFDPPHARLGMLRSGLDRIEFIDVGGLTAPCGALDLPVLIPVTSEFQAEELRTVRVRHPLSLLIAVTHDISGYRTYYAIRSGANFVLNLAIPGECHRDLLYAQLRAHRAAGAADAIAVTGATSTTGAMPVDGAADGASDSGAQGILPEQGGARHRCRYYGEAPSGAPSASAPPTGAKAGRESDMPEGRPQSTVSSYDADLFRLLRTPITVAEIARRHYYCSERSMYRRIRRLYDDLGVTGRAELMSLGAELGPRRPMTARAS
ncbi:hypothetical protein [Streptomyces sp. NPDC056061]|uniref:hypothetical protein n=1 Tax=Streptomyces sp. NPDC056061 TaxID=3345700 RepID=UPI0035E0C976